MARFQWIIELGILVFLADHGLEWLLLGGLLIAVRESIVRLINFRSEQTESELKDIKDFIGFDEEELDELNKCKRQVELDEWMNERKKRRS
jgi:hypothetical protein